jgi:hypothetical protein
MNGPIVYSYALLPGAEDEIYRKISDITISMKCTDHLKMPEKIITQAEAVMSDAETARYEKMKKELVLQLDGEEITAANAASLSGKLCQMANGAVYSDDGKITRIHDRKLDVLEDIIEAANGKPLLVAYWFRHDFERIAERLHERKIPFEKLDSDDSIRRWNRKGNSGRTDPSGKRWSWPESSGRWQHDCMVRTDMEPWSFISRRTRDSGGRGSRRIRW